MLRLDPTFQTASHWNQGSKNVFSILDFMEMQKCMERSSQGNGIKRITSQVINRGQGPIALALQLKNTQCQACSNLKTKQPAYRSLEGPKQIRP